jgi:hypothetical protein
MNYAQRVIHDNFGSHCLFEVFTTAPTQNSAISRSVAIVQEGTEWIIEGELDSSIRIALFILPLVVLPGWLLDTPDMSLVFDGF